MAVVSTLKNKGPLPIISTLLLAPFILGMLWPDVWWGSHFIYFIPDFLKFGLLLVAILLIVNSWLLKKKTIILERREPPIKVRYLITLGFGLLAGLIFYTFPIAGDFYGNARGFLPRLDQTITELPNDFFSKLFSFKFVPGNGRRGVMLLVELTSYLSGVSIYESFRLLGAVCGSLFVVVWLSAVRHFIQARSWKILLALVGLSSPMLLIFFGHVETYAPVYLLLLSWLLLLVVFIRKGSLKQLFALILLLIIGIRLHTLMYLLLPAFLLAIVLHFNKTSNFLRTTISTKGILTRVFIPICLLGLVVYFFVLGDHNDPRVLEDFEDIDRLFLPLFSPDAPLDKYNLLSFNHIFDYLNVALMWSPALLLLLSYAIVKRKEVAWAKPEIAFLVLIFLLYFSFLFMVNPLFSMPMDWDLFMFPVPVLLVFVLLLVEQVQVEGVSNVMANSIMALVLMCIPPFIVMPSLSRNSYRMESTAVHIYHTYYIHSSTYMLYAIGMIRDLDLYLQRQEELINRIEPYAPKGNDKQFADLLIDRGLTIWGQYQDTIKARTSLVKSMDYHPISTPYADTLDRINVELMTKSYPIPQEDREKAKEHLEAGKSFLRETGEFEKALEELWIAYYYNPSSNNNLLLLMECNYRLKQYEAAFLQAQNLLALEYPSKEKALKIAVHMALEAKKYEEAYNYCTSYLSTFESNDLIVSVLERLDKKDRVEELVYLFNRG